MVRAIRRRDVKHAHMELEMDGHVYLVDYNAKGEEAAREQLDDVVVLKGLLYLIDVAVGDRATTVLSSLKKPRRPSKSGSSAKARGK